MRRRVPGRGGAGRIAARSVAAACLVVGFGTALPRSSAHAADGAPAAAGAAPPSNVPTAGVLRLGLNDAVRLAVENNLDVELVRFDPLIAEQDLKAAWGAYDPAIFGNGGYSNIETPVASNLLSGSVLKERTWAGEAGLQGLVPWLGGAYAVSYASSEVEGNSSISILSPSYGAGFLASLEVPILRGLFWDRPWTQVRLSKIGVEAAREQFAEDLMNIVRNTEDAYWRLIALREATAVARKSLETANALLEQTQAQYEVGVVSRVEVVQAEAGVADRDFRLITADAVERNAQDLLIDVVMGPYLGPRTELTVETTDDPDEIPVHEVDPEVAVEHAFLNRPDLAVARDNIERRQVELKFASNQRLPQLDAQASYGNQGLSGSIRRDCVTFLGGRCTSTVPRRWKDANNDFFTGDAAEQLVVQGLLTIPIGNVRARADYSKAGLELRRAQTALRRLEQSIIADIRRAARNLLASIEGLEAADRNVAAAEEQLRAERVRLEYGESTPFDVLLREQDLVTAENQRILAQQAYHNAVTELDRAQGTILSRNGILVEEAAALR